MEGEGFLSDILLNGDDGHVAGLDDMSFPMTQNTQTTDGIPSELEPINVDVQPSRSTKGAKRQKNFDCKEDLVLCSGWINVSKDPILGANQTRSTFWGRVHAFFEKNKTTVAVRTESSIMHRWLTIQHQVNKFCACYDSIQRRNKSGCTIQDMVADALEMYSKLDKDKKKFTLMPCWNKLKGEDKWKLKRKEIAELEKQAKQKKNKNKKASRPREEEALNNEEGMEVADQETEEQEPKKRPEGVKKAKESLKRGGGEACMEALDKMWAKKEAFDMEKEKAKEQRFLASLELEKEALEIKKKRAQAELMKEEKEIMLVDKSKLDTLGLQYCEIMQKKILARLSSV